MTIEIGGPSSGGGAYYGGGDSGNYSLRNVVKGFGPPPAFLTKTFHMVNDPNSNSVISWGRLGDSFIIWDHIKFSADVLPNYFRHNNFSSFVYQLNNYGFRKIGVDHQWEYTSPDFQEGKPHLLSNMKRRSLHNSTPRRQKTTLSHETLNKSIDESRREIKKLKKQQSDIELYIAELRQKATTLEATSKKLVVQWAKACEIIVKRERERREKPAAVAEIPPQENEENHENEAVKEEAGKQPVVLSSAADDESEPTAMTGDYSVLLDDVKKRLFEDDDNNDEVFEDEAANRNAMAQDFEEWLIESSTTLW